MHQDNEAPEALPATTDTTAKLVQLVEGSGETRIAAMPK